MQVTCRSHRLCFRCAFELMRIFVANTEPHAAECRPPAALRVPGGRVEGEVEMLLWAVRGWRLGFVAAAPSVRK